MTYTASYTPEQNEVSCGGGWGEYEADDIHWVRPAKLEIRDPDWNVIATLESGAATTINGRLVSFEARSFTFEA